MRRRQQGVALILAIIVLVAMSLAAIGLMRGVLTGNRVAANLAFQQSARQSSETGAETAIAWLEQKSRELVTAGQTARANKLFQNITASPTGEAYNYAASREDPDSTTNQTWDAFWNDFLVPNGRVNTLAADSAGNTVSFVIHRLCNAVGDPSTGISCEVSPAAPPSNQPNRSTGLGGGVKPANPQVYYRITVRVAGPRNATSFTQVVVAI
ncbi:MAG: hypothetical protein GXC94_11255 [Comamonadaceae bacterium]|jgi:Tfp pilus assembly protein PilX|nr:hypothetical protein [Comamonadaceae bacterium]